MQMKRSILPFIILVWLVGFSGTVLHGQEKSTPDYDLLMAADAGSLKHVRIAIIEGANPDARTEYGVTPLMYAAQAGYLEITELLIKMDASIDATPYNSNRTSLMAAVENGHVEVAEFLIRKGADLTITDFRERGLMHKAALSGVWEMCDLLIYYDMPADPVDIEKRTPLMLAAFDGFDASIRVLLANGADVNHRDVNLNTALHMAAQNGHVKVIAELLKAGADTEAKNEEGYTPLDLAVMYGRLESSKQLRESGAQINDSIRPAFNQLTLAKKSGNRKLVRYLKDQGASNNIRPYFTSAGLGMNILSNRQNTILSGLLTLHEDKYNLDIDIIVGTRGKKSLVPVPITDNHTYLIYENRYIAGLGINKNFEFSKDISGWRYGFTAGINHMYTWANYTGYRPDPADDFTTGFAGSLYARYDLFKISSGYQYLNLPVNNYTPHHFLLNFHLYLNFDRDIYYNILL